MKCTSPWALVCVTLLLLGAACTEPMEGEDALRTSPPDATAEGASPSPETKGPTLTLMDLQAAVDKTIATATGRYRLEVRESHGPTTGPSIVEGVGAYDLDQELFDLRYNFSYVEGEGWGAGTKVDPHARVIIRKDEAFIQGPDEDGRLSWRREPMAEVTGPSLDLDETNLHPAPPPLQVLPFALSIWPLEEVKEWPEFASYEVTVHGADMLHLINSAWMNGYLEDLPPREIEKIFGRSGSVQIGLDDKGMIRAMKTRFDPFFMSAIGASLRLGLLKPKQAREDIEYLQSFELVFIAWLHDLGEEVSFILPDLDEIGGRSI